MTLVKHIIAITIQVSLLCCFMLFSFHSGAQSKFVIDESNSPYYITSDTTIALNDTLIIGPGAKVIVSDSVNIFVKGRLRIEGEPTAKAEIRPLNPRIGWGEIRLEYSSDTLIIKDAIVEDGRILSFESVNYFEHVDFINHQNLVWNAAIGRFIRGELKVSNCKVVGTNTGEGFLVHRIDNPMVTNCRFDSIPDAIEYLNCTDGLIRNCQFFNMRDDAIDLNHCVGTVIDSNLIVNVENRGMEIGSEDNGSSLDIYCYRNVLVNCTEGINFKEGSEGIIKNNTFFSNKEAITVVTDGRPIAPSSVEVVNSIFHQNDKVFNVEMGSNLSIKYSSSSTAFLNGEGNLFSVPYFVNTDKLDFNLQQISPCIDAGDTLGANDLDGTRADMGAFYRHKSVSNPSVEEVRIWPIPLQEEMFIRTVSNFNTLQVYNQSGTLVLEKEITRSCDLCSYQVNVEGLKSGLYIIHLKGENELRRKIIKL